MKSLYVLIAALAIQGCANHPTTVTANYNSTNVVATVTSQITSNLVAGVGGHYDPTTGQWDVGIIVTFKDSVPRDLEMSAESAGAIALRSPNTFKIEKLDFNNKRQVEWLQAADRVGATKSIVTE